MNAWFGFAGSIEMLDTARPGAFASSVSRRVNVTFASLAALAFFEMKTRPVVVDAHSVELSLVARETQPTLPPERVVPYVQPAFEVGVHVRRPPDVGSPSRTQS